MGGDERVALTGAMTRSGEVLQWDLDRPVLDKHSTGGVGDKVSLLLAPIVAACGGAVPMISGRGLGHTGGTLDKLDAIPGYDTAPDRERFAATVREAGCAIIGQTGDLAPADRRLYAIRDATGTVESIPLIVASILSKKLAAGLDALVHGRQGRLGRLPARARPGAASWRRRSSRSPRATALPCAALLTDMDRVLGRTAGNAVEVRESIDHLTGAASDPRLLEVTLRALRAAAAPEGARRRPARRARVAAARPRHFARMVAALGGPADLLERPDDHLPAAPVVVEAQAERPGVRGRHRRARRRPGDHRPRRRPRREDDAIDHAVGLTEVAAPGERVGPRAGRWRSSTRATRTPPTRRRGAGAAVRVGDRRARREPRRPGGRS